MRTWLGIAAAILALTAGRAAVEAAPPAALTELRALDDGWQVLALAFSSDGKTLASGGADYRVHLWDPLTGENRRTLKGHEHLVLSLAFSPDGKMLASGSYDQTLKLWKPGTGARAGTVPLPGWVHALQFSPDRKTLAAGLRAQHGALRLWQVNPAPPVAGALAALRTARARGHASGE